MMGDGGVVPARVQNVLDMDVVRLNLWSIQFSGSGVQLEGFVRSEDGNMMQKVHSGTICRRMTATMLFDVAGCFYELAGQIDREFQLKIGMPSRVIDEFTNGFPDNWTFLIKSCLNTEPKSVMRPIQAAPREPFRTRGEPIVTMPDETLLAENLAIEKDRKRKEREGQQKREHEERLRGQREEEQREAADALEEKRQKEEEKQLQEEEEKIRRQEEEEEAANYTLRAPQSQCGEPITPIRYVRGNGQKGANIRPIFDKTPVSCKRTKSVGPLASSTPQAPPPQQERRPSNIENKQPESSLTAKPRPPVQNPIRETQYCSDSEFFAVPKLPASRSHKNSTASTQSAPLDFLDEMDALFETANVDKTPGREKKPRKVSRSPSPEFYSSSREGGSGYHRNEFSRHSHNQRYNEDYNTSRMSRRNDTFRKNEGRRDESQMSRKRGHNNSPDEYSRRWEDRSRRQDHYDPDTRHDTKRPRPRDQSSSSGRSVRFEQDYPRRRPDSRDSSVRRDYRDYEVHRNRESSGDREEQRKLSDILRREREIMTRLQNSQRSSTFRRTAYSSEEDELADEWDRENQEILDNSTMFDDGLSEKKQKSGGRQFTKQTKTRRPPQPKPARKPAQPKKNNRAEEIDEMNDSIASSRPRRACATPSTPAPKRITWPKRDLDKLQHTISLKKPTGADADWAEVARLLAKDGVDPETVKQVAISKLKWKEPSQETIQMEEEEKKKRRGAAARVKEGVRMHEELREGGDKRGDNSQGGVEALDDYQPDDVAADQSLLALQTPIAMKKRGGTRASIMPQPVEDSPVAKGSNSTFNSPRLDQTRAKEVETTLKYVQHLSMMNARPSSRANTSYLNKSPSRGGGSKNTSLSVEQGTRKALKMMNRGRTIHEEDEDDDVDGEITID